MSSAEHAEEPEKEDAKNEGNENGEARDALLQSILQPKCDLCGSSMTEFHCRLICRACGYQRDCSDP